MKKQSKPYFLFIGIFITISATIFAFIYSGESGIMERLPLAILGCGIVLIGIGGLQLTMSGNPEKMKQLEIEEKDERNVKIREKAGFAVWFLTFFMLTILFLTFVIIGIEIAAWLTAGVLFIHIIGIVVCAGVFSRKI